MTATRTFSQCPECNATFVNGAGMARHRIKMHGVAPAVAGGRKPKPVKISFEERMARLEAMLAARDAE